MNLFSSLNKNLLTYSLLILLLIPIFGVNFLASFIGNILILLFLIPIFLLLLVIIVFNSYRSKFNKCDNCGAISFGTSDNCMNCGSELENINKESQINKQPSERTIEVKAEEVK